MDVAKQSACIESTISNACQAADPVRKTQSANLQKKYCIDMVLCASKLFHTSSWLSFFEAKKFLSAPDEQICQKLTILLKNSISPILFYCTRSGKRNKNFMSVKASKIYYNASSRHF